MTLRKNSLVINFYNFIETSVLPGAKKLFKTPYHFTVLGLVLALMVPFGFYIHPFFGLFFITFSGKLVEFISYILRIHPPFNSGTSYWMSNDNVINISKSKKELGFKQKVSLKEGIKNTVLFYERGGLL